MFLNSVNTGAGIYLFRTLRLLSQLHTFVLLFTLSPQRRFPAELCLYWPGDSHTMGLPGGNCEVIFGRVSSTVIFCMETATSGQRKCSVSHHLRLVFSDITVRCFCMFSVWPIWPPGHEIMRFSLSSYPICLAALHFEAQPGDSKRRIISLPMVSSVEPQHLSCDLGCWAIE